MNWLVQAAVQKILAYVPYGHECNYVIRRHITKRLPHDHPTFMWVASNVARHFTAFCQYNRTANFARASFYEIGAGWEFTVPLLLHAFGVEHQVLVDIERNARLELINHTIRRIADHKAELQNKTCISLRDIEVTPVADFEELKRRFGIEYRAPADARNTGFEANSFDFVSSTATLEHIPREELKHILSETVRILKPGGIMSNTIDIDDHASHISSNVSCYNFLRFSDRQWSLITTNTNYQNRLRYPDYIQLFDDAGFTVIAEEPKRARETELRSLRAMKLASKFKMGYSLEDLAVHILDVVLIK